MNAQKQWTTGDCAFFVSPLNRRIEAVRIIETKNSVSGEQLVKLNNRQMWYSTKTLYNGLDNAIAAGGRYCEVANLDD